MKSVFGVLAAIATGALGLSLIPEAPPPFEPPELVRIEGGEIDHRPLGNFSSDGKTRTPRAVRLRVGSFDIMKYQVSVAQYAACVADGACQPTAVSSRDLPRTHVSWQDATDFAHWYSDRTGETWRLPSEPEWQLAAAESYGEAETGAVLDPGARMLAAYEEATRLRGKPATILRAPGRFGINSNGLADISGNVWEWTDSCMRNGTIRPDGSLDEGEPYCGVRIAGGRHRAAIISFVRDASVGGCAVGLPPQYLGFRLVRAD